MIPTSLQTIGNAKNFKWGEATKDGLLEPTNPTIYKNICTTASYMERVREYLGNQPLIVTSWFRTHKYNSQIGGANNSYHLLGIAVDFKPIHMSADEAYSLLDNWHGDKGGLGVYPKHIHIDLRGVKARWFKHSY